MLRHLRDELARCRALPGPVHVLFAIRFVSAMGNFVFPFTTLYLSEKLHLPGHRVGLFVMANALALMPGALLGGRIADGVGRRPVLVGASLVAAACLLACTLVGETMAVPWLLVGVSFLQGAVPPATNALVTDLTTAHNRRTAFAWLYLGTNAGFAAGPVFAGFLFARHAQLIFLGNLAAALATATLTLALLPETRPAAPQRPPAQADGLLPLLRRSPTLVSFLALQSLFGMLFAQAGFLLAFQLNHVFGVERGAPVLGTLMTTNGLVVVLGTTLLTALTARVPVLLNIALAGALFGVGMGGNSFVSAHLAFVACTVVWSVGEVLLVTNANVHVANRAPEHLRARLSGVNGLFFGAGMAAGPALMGWFVERRGLDSAWQVVLAIGLVAAAGLTAVWRAERGSAPAPARPAGDLPVA